MVPLVRVPLPDNQDFLLYPTFQANLILYFDIMDYKTSKILIRKASDWPLCILGQQKLGHLLDIAYENYFLKDTKSAYDTAAISLSLHFFFNLSAEPILPPTDSLMETVLKNGIRIYGDASAVKQIFDLVVEYPFIWESHEFV